MARKEIGARKAQVIAERSSRDRAWRYAFFGLVSTLLLALVAWPGTPLNWKMYAVVHGVCAQIHNVEVGGLQLPLCARNTGIYSSFLITSLYLLALGRRRAARLPPRSILVVLALFVVIMAIDGFNSMFVDMFLPHLYTPRNEIRTLTGIGMGTTIAVMMFLILNLSLRRDPANDQPIIRNWLELGGALLINLLVLLAMYGNVAIMFWPIAIAAWLGITGVLYCVNLLITALFMRYEGTVTRAAQLVKPATIALAFTLLELGALAAMRFWLESSGMIVGG